MRYTLLIFTLLILSLTTCKKKKETQQGANDVFMNGSSYSPASLTVAAGTTVKWTNKESSVHTVTSDNGTFSGSGDMSKDNTFSYTFSSAGTYPYHCLHHSSMKGTIIVQ